MGTSKAIKKPIEKEMQEFNKRFKHAMKSSVPLLNLITRYVIKQKGKQMRPMLVFLCSKMLGGTNDSSYTAASLIELLHTATLIHDDVVDEAYERRGFLSINALWKSKIAVLLGDYLLAQGLLMSVENKEHELLRIVSEAVKEMSEGELLQIQKTRKLNLTESEYLEIITKKTATLIAACTACGAESVGADQETVDQFKDFGTNLGIAFQIKDDLFDYDPESITGKPKGNDVKEKKLTMPLIAALEKAPKSESKRIVKLINKKSSKSSTFQTVYDFVHQYDGVGYTKNKMNQFKAAAINSISNLPDNEAKQSMMLLINYITERKK